MTTETNAVRLEKVKADRKIAPTEHADGVLLLNLSDVDWLIQQAEKVRKLERQNMRYQRALKHITVFPTYFSREYHSKRALKIARKVLKGTSS